MERSPTTTASASIHIQTTDTRDAMTMSFDGMCMRSEDQTSFNISLRLPIDVSAIAIISSYLTVQKCFELFISSFSL